MFDLETQIQSWSDHLRAHGNLSDADIHELENHLRDEIEDLIAAGLTPDESFLISVKRLGNVDAISHEFAKVNTESLWKLFISRSDRFTGQAAKSARYCPGGDLCIASRDTIQNS